MGLTTVARWRRNAAEILGTRNDLHMIHLNLPLPGVAAHTTAFVTGTDAVLIDRGRSIDVF